METLILANCSISLLMTSLCLVVLMWMDVILCEQTLLHDLFGVYEYGSYFVYFYTVRVSPLC